ncbi:nitrile hydratase subunit beta [Puniceibacterium sediminis]|uniref:nitrile hydratase n=1 Tax=Puniceibacterium sediminis TaxID=1608407 RepID=A0A238UVX7_9RHOB|nr:nitrile hydratase subunit beta [Puniceibacterium sediminis]SNR26041.1 nitrile hydratase [Puniceibacterium sediminis]
MSRVHDMGGRFGDGAVVPEAEDAPLHAPEWHKRALAMTVASGALGAWPIDAARRARESVAPKDYARFSYYEKWIAGLADLLVERGLVSAQELRDSGSLAGDTPVPGPLDFRALRASKVAEALERGGPSARENGVSARFAPGDSVRTLRPAANRIVEGGHTRLPGYAAGATGRVLMCHGAHVLPDTNAHGLGECPEPLYAVVFAASELWVDAENPRDEVILDLWQSYLVPA